MTPSAGVLLEPEFLFMLALIGASVWFAVAARRRQVPRALVAVAASNLFCGGLVAGLGGAHLAAVVGRAMASTGTGAEGTFVYDFRFYSLVLLGVLLMAGGLACVSSLRRLTRGEPAGWSLAFWTSIALLAINVPLMPIQGFAVGFSAFLSVNLVILVLTRWRFRNPRLPRVPPSDRD